MINVLIVLGSILLGLFVLWWLIVFVATIWTRACLMAQINFYQELAKEKTEDLQNAFKELSKELEDYNNLNNKDNE